MTFLPVYDLLSRRIKSLLEAPKAAGGEATLGRNLTVYMARCGLNRLMSVGQAFDLLFIALTVMFFQQCGSPYLQYSLF